jgi:formyltetrahydrofolate synthetase
MGGGVARADLGNENVQAVTDGCANLGRHIENMKNYGVPAVVAINHFITDTDAEIQAVKDSKTQYSFSTDPNLRGAPTGHSVPVREVRLSAGAGFIVAICGEIMTMPGLPRAPSSEKICLNDNGQIEGLF